jgi:hypothetical protein
MLGPLVLGLVCYRYQFAARRAYSPADLHEAFQ